MSLVGQACHSHILGYPGPGMRQENTVFWVIQLREPSRASNRPATGVATGVRFTMCTGLKLALRSLLFCVRGTWGTMAERLTGDQGATPAVDLAPVAGYLALAW